MQSKKLLWFSIGALTILINILYFTNLIPPIPLSLKDAGVYHSINRNTAGDYTVTEEDQGFWSFFHQSESYHTIAGRPIYLYTSIFSPTSLDTSVIHDWQYYSTSTRNWISAAQIELPILGGREDGYRTYSVRNASEGLWRVDVTTLDHQLIGRIKFTVENVDTLPPLTTTTIL